MPVNADQDGAPARRAPCRAGIEDEAFRDVVARRDEKLARRVGAVLPVPDSSPTTLQCSSSERDSEAAARSCARLAVPLVRAESRRRRVDVGVPGAEVGAVDRVQHPVGLAAADAQAVARARQRRPAFEAERALVVDGEAALEDDRRVAAAGRRARRIRRAAAPRRRRRRDTPQSGVKASLSVTGTLSRRTPASACSCVKPDSTSSQPGADRAAGVDTLGRYGTTEGEFVLGRHRGLVARPRPP